MYEVCAPFIIRNHITNHMGSYVHDKQSVMLFQKIAEELGRPDWNNVNNPCVNTSFRTTSSNDVNLSINITCNCSVANDSFCHITSMYVCKCLPYFKWVSF